VATNSTPRPPTLISKNSRTLLLLATILLACSGTRDSRRSDGERQDDVRFPTEDQQSIQPGHCRIVGTILEISQNYVGTGADDPCAKAPCLATVRVDTVLGYGSAFGHTLGEGKRIMVRFLYTLGPTKNMFPSLPTQLPGLTVDSRFQADVSSTDEPQMGGRSGPMFVVGMYRWR